MHILIFEESTGDFFAILLWTTLFLLGIGQRSVGFRDENFFHRQTWVEVASTGKGDVCPTSRDWATLHSPPDKKPEVNLRQSTLMRILPDPT